MKVKKIDKDEKHDLEFKQNWRDEYLNYHGKYYKRSGSTTQEVVDNELDKMILAVQGRTWDSVPVPHVDVADLDNDSIKLFKKMALDHNRLDSKALDVTTAFTAKKHSFSRRRHSASCF